MVKIQKKVRYTLDATAAVENAIIDIADLARYYQDRVKVDGKVNNLGNKVVISTEESKLIIEAELPFSKRYIKYLAKKYLAKNTLRDFLRVVAPTKTTYEFRFFDLNGADEEDQE